MKRSEAIYKNRGRPYFGLPLFFILALSISVKAQYHISWTRTFSEKYPLLFYPAQTADGILFSNYDAEGIKIVKLNNKGKMILNKVIADRNDSESVAYRDFFPSTKGQLFHEGYGAFYQNTRNSVCLKKTDRNYNTIGFGGLVNTYKKPTSFETSAGHFEFSDSSVAKIELARIEKWENEYTDLVFTKYDKNGKLISSYVNKDWETGYYDYVTRSFIRWKTFTINDSTLMVYGGHTQKDSMGVMGFLILDGNGKIKGVKDELDILKLKNRGKVYYDLSDVIYCQNKFYIYYHITQWDNKGVDIRRVLVCNSNFDSLNSYAMPKRYSFFQHWGHKDYYKFISYINDPESNILPTDINEKLCIADTLTNIEKCFQLRKILGNHYFKSNTPQDADYNVFSLHHRLATYDGGLLLIYTREYPYYDASIGGYLTNTEEIVVKISPGDGLDTLGHEADDTNVIVTVKPEKEVLVFPNPNNTNTLNVNTDKWQSIMVYNTIGQVIKTYANTSLKYKDSIDISALAAGHYYLQIKLPEKTVYHKFIRH
jgi:hypothetical protein